jgi:hypothetical protein
MWWRYCHMRLNKALGLGLVIIWSVVVLLLFSAGRGGEHKGKTGALAHGFGGGQGRLDTAGR